MMDNSAARQELNEVLNDMGDYTMNATDFVNSMANMRKSAKVGGRGRGIVRPVPQDSLAEVRLAAQINRLLPKAVPIGQLATTEDTLARDFDTEITAGLRAMGIYGADGVLRSDRTRRTMLDGKDMHVDGDFPVILNRDLFQERYLEGANDEANAVPPQTSSRQPAMVR
uniref:Uncharacterized protein n=1 Tax=Anopheles atroparvus TaxID=41427 RepID=A0A182JF52_ANOAO